MEATSTATPAATDIQPEPSTPSPASASQPEGTLAVLGPEAVEAPADKEQAPARDPRFPLTVTYCPISSLPAELHEYVSRNQFEKCKGWLRKHAPQYFPDIFPDECAARLEAIRIAEESGGPVAVSDVDEGKGEGPKVAVPIEQKTSGGKKKKAPAEIVLMLGQRKGKKQVTIVYGLDLFGIKLKEASKTAKRKFATGCSLSISADNREVVEIQGSRQGDMAELVHKEWGVPKEVIYIVNAQKKKVKAFQ